NADLGMQFHRMEQASASILLFAMPFMLQHLLHMTPKWKKINRAICVFTLIIAAAIVSVAFVIPDLFISVTNHRADYLLRQADHGRGREGVLYMARDGLLALMILYTLGCFIADMIMHKRLRYLLLAFSGLLIAVFGAIVDVTSVYTGRFYDLTPDLRYSRFVVGMTIFILFSMGAVLRKFFDISAESERIGREAQLQAEKNSKQNDFIKHTLKDTSADLHAFSESLLSSISNFTNNTQDQAAATEEVTASIEEIAAGIESVKNNIDSQFASISDLSGIVKNASGTMKDMVVLAEETLHRIGGISANARSGEESLSVMSESMNVIGRSSGEITGIIEIINDISDQINLLSLNAAIEAARAGDFGRGFAVVAGEISKLADQTARSIKNIGDLIINNDKEIKTGSQKISAAVLIIKNIIRDIEAIVSGIEKLSSEVNRQSGENNAAAERAEKVRGLSEQIMLSMDEQKTGIGEISRSVGSINELAQLNTGSSIDITGTAKSLVEKVEMINRDIDNFRPE
ncbi:MAG: methyl-accepting chemotaxis protein, partial [Spirochaetota bacterium]